METYVGIALGTHEAAFNLHKRGLIEEAAYRLVEAMTRRYLRRAMVQQWWGRNRDIGKDPAYVALLDGMVVEVNAPRPAAAPLVRPPA